MLEVSFAIARSATSSRLSAATTSQIAQRWHHGSNPLHLRHFSAISRTNRRHKMSIQRLLSRFPPDNSAEVMQFLQHILQNYLIYPKFGINQTAGLNR
ncbi:MAG: hypothetical protein GC179_20235 [Anaerolineaceae bacterium]|nr:hypothetical protein [Anaerolineaceae bacterium]